LQTYYDQNQSQKRLTETDLDFDRWLAAFRAAQKGAKSRVISSPSSPFEQCPYP
jgi:hypothetical protein